MICFEVKRQSKENIFLEGLEGLHFKRDMGIELQNKLFCGQAQSLRILVLKDDFIFEVKVCTILDQWNKLV
jgi:hypothetical protein